MSAGYLRSYLKKINLQSDVLNFMYFSKYTFLKIKKTERKWPEVIYTQFDSQDLNFLIMVFKFLENQIVILSLYKVNRCLSHNEFMVIITMVERVGARRHFFPLKYQANVCLSVFTLPIIK